MKKHIIAPHTADVRLIVEGTTLPELFNAGLEGMASIITTQYQEAGPTSSTIEISISSPDITTLFIDFLSDVLTKTHLNRALYSHAEFITLKEQKLHAQLRGIHIKKFDEDIKAVTYHEANIIKNERGNYQTMIVFDI